jgi:hypothetical protein
MQPPPRVVIAVAEPLRGGSSRSVGEALRRSAPSEKPREHTLKSVIAPAAPTAVQKDSIVNRISWP